MKFANSSAETTLSPPIAHTDAQSRAIPLTVADYAAAYVREFGFALVPLPPRSKRPTAEDWGKNVITDPEAARAFYEKHPDWNIGAALGPSRLCSLDVDDLEATRLIFSEFGWDLDELAARHPTTQGQAPGLRVLFRVPEGVSLPYHALTWPKREGKGRFTVWELRAADEQQRQDVLPPSIHPDTGKPYTWITRPSKVKGVPTPPDFLLKIWENWEALKPQFVACCPWAERKAPKPAPRAAAVPSAADSVIDAYNAGHSIEQALSAQGYTRQGNRWLSPHSKTKLPGVTIFDSNKAWIHHASDPLCSVETERPVGPFDVFCQYEHGGDAKKAVRAAAKLLGMEHTKAPRPHIDPETGEILDTPPQANDNGQPGNVADNMETVRAAVADAEAGEPRTIYGPEVLRAIGQLMEQSPGEWAALRARLKLTAHHVVKISDLEDNAAKAAKAATVSRKRSKATVSDPADGNPLNWPLPEPEKVFHPAQMKWKRDKETGELACTGAMGTTENMGRLLRAYGIDARYNEMSRADELMVDGRMVEGDKSDNIALKIVSDICELNKYPVFKADNSLSEWASRNSYNPAVDWLRSKPWDGQARIQTLFECLTLKDKSKAALSWTLFKKWMLGAVAILTARAKVFEHALVLVDPMGGTGKTRFFRSLCPVESFRKDGVTLDPSNKDSVSEVISRWLVELGEIDATFSKSDIAALKAFLSKEVDTLRRPYDKRDNNYPRRTAFMGTVNRVNFLADETNNRRFWPIEVTAVNWEHGIDMQQAWAEAEAMIDAGEIWHLTPEENLAIGEHNQAFRAMERVEELILTRYDPDAMLCRYMTTTDVLIELCIDKPGRGEQTKAGAVLGKYFAKKMRKGITVYHMPERIADVSRPTVAYSARYE